jgi:hypothetical protein
MIIIELGKKNDKTIYGIKESEGIFALSEEDLKFCAYDCKILVDSEGEKSDQYFCDKAFEEFQKFYS